MITVMISIDSDSYSLYRKNYRETLRMRPKNILYGSPYFLSFLFNSVYYVYFGYLIRTSLLPTLISPFFSPM